MSVPPSVELKSTRETRQERHLSVSLCVKLILTRDKTKRAIETRQKELSPQRHMSVTLCVELILTRETRQKERHLSVSLCVELMLTTETKQ